MHVMRLVVLLAMYIPLGSSPTLASYPGSTTETGYTATPTLHSAVEHLVTEQFMAQKVQVITWYFGEHS